MHGTHSAGLGVVHVAADGVEVLVGAAVVLIVVDARHLPREEQLLILLNKKLFAFLITVKPSAFNIETVWQKEKI